MGRIPDCLGPDVRGFINDNGLTLSRTTVSAVVKAHQAGFGPEFIGARVIDAATKTAIAGRNKVGAFSSAQSVIREIAEDAFQRQQSHKVQSRRGAEAPVKPLKRKAKRRLRS